MPESILTPAASETTTPVVAAPAATPAAAVPAVAKTETVVPEKYSLKAPDGYDVAGFEKTARELGLSNDAAQKLLEREQGQSKAFQDGAKAQMTEAAKKWVESVRADKEIGGEGFKGSVEAAHRALDKFGSKELRDALDATGFGNHPEIVRVFARIGKAMSEDKFHAGEQGKDTKPRDAATLLYGSK